MYIGALFLSAVVFVLVNALYFIRGNASLFHPFSYYSLFHGIVFVVRPVVAYAYGYSKIYGYAGFVPSLSDKLTVIGAANLAFIVYFWISTRVGRSPMEFKVGSAQAIHRQLVRRTLLMMLVICLPLGLYSLLAGLGQVAQGTSDIIMTKTGVITGGTNGYIIEGHRLLVPICALSAWLFRFRLIALAPLATYFVLKFATGGRGSVVMAALITLLFYLYDRRKRFPGIQLAALAVPLLLVFTAVGDDRGRSIREQLGIQNERIEGSNRDGERFLEGMDFANMEYFEYLVYVVPQRSQTYDYFLSNLQLFTEGIPRALWRDKPIGQPIKLIDLFQYGRPAGFSMSMPGVGWYELGWLGVFLWAGFWGWVTGRFYEWFVTSDQSTLKVATYIVSLASLIIVFRDGTILTLARGQIFYLFPILVIFLLSRAARVPGIARISDILMRRQVAKGIRESEGLREIRQTRPI